MSRRDITIETQLIDISKLSAPWLLTYVSEYFTLRDFCQMRGVSETHHRLIDSITFKLIDTGESKFLEMQYYAAKEKFAIKQLIQIPVRTNANTLSFTEVCSLLTARCLPHLVKTITDKRTTPVMIPVAVAEQAVFDGANPLRLLKDAGFSSRFFSPESSAAPNGCPDQKEGPPPVVLPPAQVSDAERNMAMHMICQDRYVMRCAPLAIVFISLILMGIFIHDSINAPSGSAQAISADVGIGVFALFLVCGLLTALKCCLQSTTRRDRLFAFLNNENNENDELTTPLVNSSQPTYSVLVEQHPALGSR